MGKTPAVALAVLLAAVVAAPLLAQDDEESYQPFSADELDNLLAPIALYPDPLLAQVLVAATFPDQIDEADRFVRYDSDPNDVDAQVWDVSVKSVAHYPEVLQMMADDLDWTTALGQAYVYQSTDVMASVQRLRAQAEQAGNLVSTPEMEVVNSGGEIELWPAEPQYIYVPQYDPGLVFFARAPLFFGVRFVIGAWLNCDIDWRARHVFYHGWDEDRGWVRRSRPFIHPTNVYVNVGFRNVIVNRDVVRRRVNLPALDRYDQVHRKTTFRERPRVTYSVKGPPPTPLPSPPVIRRFNNKIIQRNVNTNDPRLKEFRGHVTVPTVKTPNAPAFIPGQSVFGTKRESLRGRQSFSVVKTPPPTVPPRPPVKRIERKHK